MSLSLQECIDKIKKEYPQHFPYTYIEIDGVYAFNLVQKGYDPKKAISDIHMVDPKTGYITGGISIMEFLKNDRLREAWKKPNLVAYHDESLGHSSDFTDGRVRGWSIRRNQNGSTSKLQNRLAADQEDELSYGGFLSHHGIKGQKWGIRRFQYENGSYTPEGKERYGRGTGRNTQGTNDGAQTKGLGLDLALTFAPELAAIATLIGLNLYHRNPKVQYKKQQKMTEKNRDVSEDVLGDIVDMDKQYSDSNPPKEINGEHSIDDDLMACNPRFNNGVVPGTTSNCTLCAFTYDMRRRGYDVAALASETGNYPEQIIKDLYKGAKEDKIKARSFTDMFKKAAEKYPEGARGEIHLVAPYFAHSMAWEVKDHKLVVMDPQRNAKYSPQELQQYGFEVNNKDNGFIRTDNLEVNMSGLRHICADYKSDGLSTAKAERAKWDKTNSISSSSSQQTDARAAAGMKQLSDSQRRSNYEKQYLKEHPNADKNSPGLKNWVKAQMAAGQ